MLRPGAVGMRGYTVIKYDCYSARNEYFAHYTPPPHTHYFSFFFLLWGETTWKECTVMFAAYIGVAVGRLL